MMSTTSKKYSFPASMRLRGKKAIQLLFAKGKVRWLGMIGFYYLAAASLQEDQVLVAVPKKYVRSAVERNTIKRRIREAYRRLKVDKKRDGEVHYMLGYVYTAKQETLPSYANIAKEVGKSFQYLS